MSTGDDALARTATDAGATPTLADRPAATTDVLQHVGRYRIESRLGAGGMGVVYAAYDPELDRRVALKLLLGSGSSEARARLLREARALARLAHPNVVAVYEVGSDEGRDYIAMELVDGITVDEWLKLVRSIRDIIRIFTAAARGLAAAHAAGLVHRDFKPHNVLLSKDQRVLVTDFGLARTADAHETAATIDRPAADATLTVTGSLLGTPAYMAPEQWNGGEVGPATDQFAFCVALWEAIACERPFRGETTAELRAAVERGVAALDVSKIPKRFRPLLLRGLDPDPAKRWPSMEALLAELERSLRISRKAAGWLITLVIALGVVPTLVGMFWPFLKRMQLEPDYPETLTSPTTAWRKEVRRFTDGSVVAPAPALAAMIRELGQAETVRFGVRTGADDQPIGLVVERLQAGSFLDAMGLSHGDVITAIDGRAVTSHETLAEAGRALRRRGIRHVRIELLRANVPYAIVLYDRDAP